MDLASHLPDDPAEGRRLLEDLLRSHDALRRPAEDQRRRAEDIRRRVDELERILEATAADSDRLKEEHAELAETLALLRRSLFGPRRERRVDDPDQGHLFDLPAAPGPESLSPTPADDAASPRPRPARPPRRARFDHLPPIRIEHDLTEAEKTCSGCGAPTVRIGEDESCELEFIPARLEVRVHVLPKYACSKCRDGGDSPPVPPKPTPGGMAGPGLVAFVVVSKFADHLPLYRLEDILTRHGVYLSRSTLGDWVRDGAAVLEPLAALQRDLVLQSPVIWTDDTPVTVLGGDQPGSSKGRFWAYIGDAEHPYSAYDFTRNWSRDGPTTPTHSVGVGFGLLPHEELSRVPVAPTSPTAARPADPPSAGLQSEAIKYPWPTARAAGSRGGGSLRPPDRSVDGPIPVRSATRGSSYPNAYETSDGAPSGPPWTQRPAKRAKGTSPSPD
jgi:transposase